MKNIVLKLGDISESVVDAIVNAGNTWLKLGGGVSGAINRGGGSTIQKELDAIKHQRAGEGLTQGEAVVTSAGSLRCRYIIHPAVVGPAKVDEGILRTSIRNCLEQARTLKCQSIAFPALGTGVGGFPIESCAKTMVDEVLISLEGETSLRGVMFVLYQEADYRIFKEVLKERDIPFREIAGAN